MLGIFLERMALGEPWEIVGFLDEDTSHRGQIVDGIPVLGDWRRLDGVDRSDLRVICATGTPAIARRLVSQTRKMGLRLCSAISPRAHVSPLARLGEGVMLFANSAVNTGACLGDGVILNLAATVSHDARVGSYANVNPGAHLAGNAAVGEGCYIGMGANVIQGVSVGEWSVIGAGAVVLQDIPPHVTAVGVPARVIKTRQRGQRD